MAKPASRRNSKQQQPRPPSPLDPQLPLVSGRWLAWSLLGIFGGGLLLVYLTLCLLFWQGQWQILFQRTQPVSAIKSAAHDGHGNELVQFDTTEIGKPRLQGLIATAGSDAAYTGMTILYLPATTAAAFAGTSNDLATFDQVGIGAFTFNYRGTVTGETEHPSEQLAAEDTEAAWNYLTGIRHIPATSIILYGSGLGASLAADAASRHPEAGGLVLDHPSPTALELLHADARSRWMPVRLLTDDRFDPTAALANARQPKLFFLATRNAAGKHYAAAAADPKLIVYLNGDNDSRQTALKRFLDEKQ